ncbi:hypothetical protein C8F01DRAFT_1119260 [Mycena amicta]|nr:hypothetical protein C8F01DRAFT_1119260 [Mycena amicta]
MEDVEMDSEGSSGEDPCEDIHDELKTILKEELDFKGQFAFGRAYSDAPNPCLTLDGVGLIGLPLSPAVAQTVISQCIQAPFGKGERTIVDKDVRDTWEMDGSNVKFRNPAWSSFMNRVVLEVCQALAVNFQASQPRAELYKLLLYETGSHFLPHVDTEKANGMFASIIVVLPSEFTGGDAYTSHSGVNATFNSSKNSLTQTTILSWYTDVMHEIKPITSGYRFALSYNLMHTTTSIRPALSSAGGAIAKLRRIFRSWNKDESADDRIYYLLDHTYSKANLSASALKGADAHVMAILDSLAKEVGFGLGLASLHLAQSGAADDNGGNRYDRYDRYNSGDDDDVSFAEDPDIESNIESFVDPDGNTIDTHSLEIDENLEEELKECGHYKQSYEGYMGNYAGTLERVYRSSVLVIWPRWSPIRGGNADRRAIGALERLQSVNSDVPTSGQLTDFHYLCDVVKFAVDDTQQEAIDQLFTLATRWRDAKLWKRAVSSICATISLNALESEHIQRAHDVFGFAVLADSLRSVIRRSSSNGRLQFLADLKECIDAEEVDVFIKELRTEILANLRPYSFAHEVEAFAKEIMSDGGAQQLCDLLLPQIQKLTTARNAAACEAFVDWLHLTFLDSTSEHEEEVSARKQLMTSLLQTLLPFKELFASETSQIPNKSYHYGAPTTITHADSTVALSLIKKCLDYDNASIAVSLIDKMMQTTTETAAKVAGNAQQDPQVAIVSAIVFSVIPTAKPWFDAHNPPIDVSPQLAKMAKTAVLLKLAELKAAGAAAVVQRDELANMLDFAKGLANAGELLGTILAGLKSLPWNQGTWALCMEEFHARRTSDQATFGPHVVEMAKVYAKNVSLPIPLSKTTYYSVNIPPNPAAYAKALNLCYLTGGREAFALVASRILQPKTLNETYIIEILVPLISDLKALAATHHVALSSSPFSQILQRIIAAWMANVLGQKPNLARVREFAVHVSRWTCRCGYCAPLVQFLRSSDTPSVHLARIGAPNVNHVRQEIATRMPGVALTLETVRSSPHGLIVTKAPELIRAAKWGGLIAQGRALLDSIGDQAEQKAIWGDTYATALGPLLPQEQRAQLGQPVAGPSRPVVPVKRKAADIIEISD